MRAVDLLRRLPEDGSEERLCRLVVRSPGGPVEMEVDVPQYREGLAHELREGALGPDGILRFPPDGEAFLDAALLSYRGSRFFAREVPDPEA